MRPCFSECSNSRIPFEMMRHYVASNTHGAGRLTHVFATLEQLVEYAGEVWRYRLDR
jgi:hypothetical protein